jgi:predicted ribosome quality control (RQC) complex YloA/Tae2 family protein
VYDVLSIAAIVDEFNNDIVEGRIQQVAQVDELTLALEVYAARQRRWLVLSAHPEHARVLLATRRVDGDAEKVTPLLLLLRKYARGGRIVSVSQPRYERIVRFSIAKPLRPNNADDAGAEDDEDTADAALVTTDLYVELMGRRSNIIMTNDEGRILDAIKRVSPEMSRVRPIRPGAAYVPPPPQEKLDPLRASAQTILSAVAESNDSLSKWLVARYLGVSPAIAREIAVRAGLDPELKVAELSVDESERLATAILDVFGPIETGRWDPTLYQWESGRADFFALAMRSLELEDGIVVTPSPSILTAAEATWDANRAASAVAPGRHAVRRDRLVAEVDEARERTRQRIHSLSEQVVRAAEAENLRERGEMIYAWISEIEPGQPEFITPEGLRITLDPTLSPSQNAQEYFERYRKARSAEENLPALLEEASNELAYLDQIRAMAALAETYDEIETVRIEWLNWAETARGGTRASKPKGARPSKQARRPRAYKTIHGDTIFVGRTGQQNDEVTFTIANPDDLWLHVRNMPGAHVILRANGRLSEDTIERAAALAAWYSDGRNATAVPVDVTERRHVRKIRGAGPGMVTYRNERTLNVRPMSETELGLNSTE